MEDVVFLGGNIQLEGFNEFDRGTMIVLKKIVGNFARKMEQHCGRLEQLSLTCKRLSDAHGGFELKAQLLAGQKTIPGEAVQKNLFIGIDTAFKEIERGLMVQS